MDDAMTASNLHRPSGSLAAGPWTVDLDQARAGWTWSSLRVLTLGPGGSQRLATGPQEMLVLPLAGSCAVTCGGERLELDGRASVFDGVTDFAYLPRGTDAVIVSERGGRFALPGALADRDLPLRYAPAADVPVELRGAGSCSRQVNNFCTPGRLRGRPAARLRGDHAGRQLVVLPAAQARRGTAGGVGARGDLLLRDRERDRGAGRAAGPVSATSGSTGPPAGRSTCSPRCAAATWC